MSNITWYKYGIYVRGCQQKNGPRLEVFYRRMCGRRETMERSL